MSPRPRWTTTTAHHSRWTTAGRGGRRNSASEPRRVRMVSEARLVAKGNRSSASDIHAVFCDLRPSCRRAGDLVEPFRMTIIGTVRQRLTREHRRGVEEEDHEANDYGGGE